MMLGPDTLFILSICLPLSVFACRIPRCLLGSLSNYPSYLYLVVVWIVRGGYLMSVYTPSQQILIPIMGSETC
jgi:hypothetical protein